MLKSLRTTELEHSFILQIIVVCTYCMPVKEQKPSDGQNRRFRTLMCPVFFLHCTYHSLYHLSTCMYLCYVCYCCTGSSRGTLAWFPHCPTPGAGPVHGTQEVLSYYAPHGWLSLPSLLPSSYAMNSGPRNRPLNSTSNIEGGQVCSPGNLTTTG